MANTSPWLFITDNYFKYVSLLDQEFDTTPANDNDLEPYSVKFCSPRDIPIHVE